MTRVYGIVVWSCLFEQPLLASRGLRAWGVRFRVHSGVEAISVSLSLSRSLSSSLSSSPGHEGLLNPLGLIGPPDVCGLWKALSVSLSFSFLSLALSIYPSVQLSAYYL